MQSAAEKRKADAEPADDATVLSVKRPAVVNRPVIGPPPNAKTEAPRMHGGSARGRLMLSRIGATAPQGVPAPAPAPKPMPGPASSVSTAGAPAAPRAPARAPPSKPLPETCQRILDTFIAIESALPLLRKRDLPPLYGMLRKPVEDLTRRDFPPELLAALVHACPTAFRVSAREVALTEERLRLTVTPHQKVDWLIEQTTAPSAPPPAPASARDASDPEQKLEVDHPPPSSGPPAVARAPAAASVPSRRLQLAEWRQARRAELVATLEAHAAQHGDAPMPMAALPPLEPPKAKAEARSEVGARTEATHQASRKPPLGAEPALTPAPTGAADLEPRAPPADALPGALPGALGVGSAAPGAPMPTMVVPMGCEGLPAELLHKVMQRQAEARVLVETQPKLQRAALLKRLPEMAMATRECMFEARRRLMPSPDLVRRLLQNAKWLSSAAELEAQLQLLTEIVPQWISLVRLGDDEELTVRLDESVSFSEVQKAVRAARSGA